MEILKFPPKPSPCPCARPSHVDLLLTHVITIFNPYLGLHTQFWRPTAATRRRRAERGFAQRFPAKSGDGGLPPGTVVHKRCLNRRAVRLWRGGGELVEVSVGLGHLVEAGGVHKGVQLLEGGVQVVLPLFLEI